MKFPYQPLLIIFSLQVTVIFFSYGQPIAPSLVDSVEVADSARVENFEGKRILVFTPHPDDETFSMGGTLALLTAKGNTVHIVIYTNDNKGSLDLEMTRERLARIRRAEEEKACEILGIPKEHITWLGYEDGDLEYADPRVLRGKVARLIKIHRPDAIFCPDPGYKNFQWHKTDHRMAANITEDAFIAAEWHLYYPQHLLDEQLLPFHVKQVYYYYSNQANYEIDVTETFELKIKASAAHVSQFPPSISTYSPEMPPETFEGIKASFSAANKGKGGGFVERFRRR